MSNQTKNDNFLIESVLNDLSRSSVSSVTSLLESYQKLLGGITFRPMINSLYEANNQLRQSFIKALGFSDIVTSAILDLNVRPILEIYNTVALTNMIQQLNESISMVVPKISEEYFETFSKYEKLFSQIGSLSEDEIETMLDGTDYTREEIYEDIEQFKQEMSECSNADNVSDVLLPEDKVNKFLKKHPALAHILYVIYIIFVIMNNVQITEDMIIPGVQSAIVLMQGNEDIFFIKVESAKLYTEPSSHSVIIMNILYGEQVTLLESTKLWDKVIYINQEGKVIVGWIAKRNLMNYKDYQFNSDELYDIN